MRTLRAECAGDDAHALAEGPVWDGVQGGLLWVDIPRAQVLRGQLDGDRVVVTRRHHLGRGSGGAHPAVDRVAPLTAEEEETAGAAVPTADGGLLIALRRGFATVSADGEVRRGPDVIPAATDSRFNDGACDPAGRFFVGTMALDDREGQEQLHRLDPDGAFSVVDGGLTLSNGLSWSTDGRTMYHIDTVPGIVSQRDYDVDDGVVGPRRELVRISDGSPDGMCVDVDNNLWVAIWGAGQVRCLDPAGRQIASVELPAPHTTSVAFVGPQLDRLLITTAREGLDDGQLAAHPLSGHLFLADVGTRGLPSTPWAGTADALPAR